MHGAGSGARDGGMGGGSSKKSSPPPPPPPPLFQEGWRKLPQRDKDLQFVKSYQPFDKVRRLRILIHGPQGAGKSSFINSVDSALRGRIATRAQADAAIGGSFTTKFTSYKIKNTGTGTFYPFVFTDIKGLERDNGVFDVENIKLALKGHIKEGYRFNPNAELTESDPFYNPNPSLDDQVHVLVCVVNAATLAILDNGAIKKLRAVRLAAHGKGRGIPQVAILTHIDEACPEVKRDIKNVYRSKHLKKQMETLTARLGIPLNCIFPVRNYCREIETDDDVDTLILSAMRKITESGEDYLSDITDEENS
ncbi:interferon-induced protein 44-like isoform 2-T2 [Pholidichthys leucotaenia]